jgi:urease accessory protein
MANLTTPTIITTTATRILTGTIMAGDKRAAPAETLSPAAQYRLMTWLSPAYPVGAFAYSGGIEWAVEAGDIGDAESLQHWLEALLRDGAGLSDGVLFCHAYRAAARGDDAAVIETAELAAALVPTRERHLETTTLGRAFIDVTQAAWPCRALSRLQELWRRPVAYPVAVGVACAGHDIPLGPSTHAFLMALTANWISAGVRLIPLGHTDGQRLLRALEAEVAQTVRRALDLHLDDIGSATFRADLGSARHETQYTRLFRS